MNNTRPYGAGFLRPCFPAGGTFHKSLRSKLIISRRTLLLAVSLLLPMCSSGPTGLGNVPPLTTVPVTPPDPTPPPLTLTKVSHILSGNVSGEVILAGDLTGPTSDSDEWVFSDGTGEIVLDFPSNDVPPVGDPIYVQGTVSSGPEIDVIAWEPIIS